MTAALGLLLVSSVAVHVDEVRGLPESDSRALVAYVGYALEALGQPARVDRSGKACGADADCLEAVLDRTGADDVLVIAAALEGSSISVRIARPFAGVAEQLSLPRAPASWSGSIRGAVKRALLAPVREDDAPPSAPSAPAPAARSPEPPSAPAPAARSPEPPAARSPPALPAPLPPPPPLVPEPGESASSGPSKVVPLIVLGASIAAGALGAMYVGRAADALEQLGIAAGGEEKALTAIPVIPDADEIRRHQEAVLTNGLAANLLLSGAAAGLVTSLVLLLQ